jgi:hypothetical protein
MFSLSLLVTLLSGVFARPQSVVERGVSFNPENDYSPDDVVIEFKNTPTGLRGEMKRGNKWVSVLVDTGSPLSFIRSSAAYMWGGSQELSEEIDFVYAGRIPVKAVSKFPNMNPVVYIAHATRIPQDVVGVLSLGPTSFLGKRLFALVPSPDGGTTTYMNKLSGPASDCAAKAAAYMPLDRVVKSTENIFLIHDGQVRLRKYIYPVSISLSTAKQGIDLPSPLYNHLVDTLAQKGVRLTIRPLPGDEFIHAPLWLCKKEYSSLLPDITIQLGEAPRTVSVTLRFSDYAYVKDGRCTVAVTKAQEPWRISIGNLLLSRLVSIFDAPAGFMRFCPVVSRKKCSNPTVHHR